MIELLDRPASGPAIRLHPDDNVLIARTVIELGARLPDGTVSFDLGRPLEGKNEFYTDLGVGYRGAAKYFGGLKYRVQLNVRNVLEPDKLVPNRVLSTGRYVAWARVEPRLFVFTVGFDL